MAKEKKSGKKNPFGSDKKKLSAKERISAFKNLPRFFKILKILNLRQILFVI